jgi:hypothetical protein
MDNKFRGFVVAAIFGAAAASTAGAVVFGGSNLGVFGYPEDRCAKPIVPYSGASEYAVRQYNLDVEMFNTCAKRYIENANADIERINEAVDKLARKAKSDY